MALALTAYEASLCAGCGLPPSKTHGDHNEGRYRVDADNICHGCEPLEAFRDESGKDTYPGQKIYLIESPDFALEGAVVDSK